jgi:hypothetical protein
LVPGDEMGLLPRIQAGTRLKNVFFNFDFFSTSYSIFYRFIFAMTNVA